MPPTAHKKRICLLTTAGALLLIGGGAFGLHSCFRRTFGEIFAEGSTRDHRKLHRYEEEPKIYTLGTSINWDATLTYRTRHKQGWQYDPGNGDPAWSIDPSR